MRCLLPVLALLAGLGCSISSAQDAQQKDPFNRYLAGIKSNQPEAALVHFAGECGVDLKTVAPRYAQLPSDSWILVKDLSKALKDQETDFYGTVAVWHMADQILVERWGMELDTGDEFRMLYCLQGQKIKFAEEVDWSIPVEGETNANPSWGYEQRWKIGQDGRYENVLHRFVDLREQTRREPQLNAETKKRLDWTPKGFTWTDLKLPSELLR